MNDKLSLQLFQTPVGRFELHILNLDYDCHFFHVTRGAFRWDDLTETQARYQIMSPFDIGEERVVQKIGNPNPQLAYWYCFDFKHRRGSDKQGPVGMFQAIVPLWTKNGWRQISDKPLELQLTKRHNQKSIKDYTNEKELEHSAIPTQDNPGLNWLGGRRVDYWISVERNHMRRESGYVQPKKLQLPPNTLLRQQYAGIKDVFDARYGVANQQTAARLGQVPEPAPDPTPTPHGAYSFPKFRQREDIPLMLYVSRSDGLVHIVNDLGSPWNMEKAMVEGHEISRDEFNRVADERADELGIKRVDLDRLF